MKRAIPHRSPPPSTACATLSFSPAPDWPRSTLKADGPGFLYGFDGRQEYGENLRCVELKSGKIRWSEDRFGAGTVTLAGKRLLILTENGELLFAPASPDRFKPAARAQLLPNGARAYPPLADAPLSDRSREPLGCLH